MNAISADISTAIGICNEITVPWIVATLENYATALRQRTDKEGNELADSIEKACTCNVVQMYVPRERRKSDADIPD